MKRLLKTVILVIVFLHPMSCLALGVQATPAHITIQAKSLQNIEQEILITNIGKQPAIYQLKIEPHTQNIHLRQDSFYLEPLAQKRINLRYQKLLPGNYDYQLKIFAKNKQAGDLGASPGVKIKITSQVGWTWWLFFAMLSTILLPVVGMFWLRRKINIIKYE